MLCIHCVTRWTPLIGALHKKEATACMQNEHKGLNRYGIQKHRSQLFQLAAHMSYLEIFRDAGDLQVKFREFLSTEYGEAQLDFLLEAMKLETLDAGERDQAATKVQF